MTHKERKKSGTLYLACRSYLLFVPIIPFVPRRWREFGNESSLRLSLKCKLLVVDRRTSHPTATHSSPIANWLHYHLAYELYGVLHLRHIQMQTQQARSQSPWRWNKARFHHAASRRATSTKVQCLAKLARFLLFQGP